jgi:hypothetical protein
MAVFLVTEKENLHRLKEGEKEILSGSTSSHVCSIKGATLVWLERHKD